MYTRVSFTREELHERVWTTPLLRLAQEVGVSDVTLGKAARKAGVPLPPRSYWATPKSKRPKRGKLPAAPKGHEHGVSFTVLDAAARASQPKLERPKVIPEVEVPATLESPHRLVAMTKAGANRATIYQGRVQLDQGLDLRVTQGLVNRSLRIADALIRACEARGWKWSVSAERKTVIHCEGQDVPFVLKERIPRRNGETKPGQPSWMAPIEYVSTGELGILLDAYTMIPVTRLWKDTPTQALEKRLGEVIAGLPLVAQAMKAHHAYWDNWRRQLDAEEARRKHEELAVEKLKRKRRRLDDFVARWEQASKIHAFCDALERRVSALPPAQAADAVAWIAWAREQATASDPLNGVPWRN